jgi:hypothetical protein
MYSEISPPRFFSLDFHVKFFPALLWRLLHPKKMGYESTFAGHIRLELPVMMVVSIAFIIYGLAAAVGSGSILGWVCGFTGLGGSLYLLIISIRSTHGIRPSFEYFRVVIFLFFVVFGATVGLEAAFLYGLPYDLKIVTGLIGFILGYFAGIVGGLWVQKLGWMASLLDVIAIAFIAGMIVLDIVILI